MEPKLFNLRLGSRIKRTVLHMEFGGRTQGGISPSAKSRNIFLFTDARTGLQHGYVDGWQQDGCFHYTGEGQRGNQQMKSGNLAVLKHVEQRRELRVFKGSGGYVTYKGRFKIDDEAPYYKTNAHETANGPVRKVIVFRLKPLDDQGPDSW